MVDLCLVVEYLVFKWWSENQTEKNLCMAQNVRYSDYSGIQMVTVNRNQTAHNLNDHFISNDKINIFNSQTI